MPLDEDNLKVARGRVTQIFQFLEAFNQLRNPAKRLISEQPWVLWLRDLPAHAAICEGVISEAPGSEVGPADTTDVRPPIGSDFILKVRRPALTRAPAPPSEIDEWLLPGWDDSDSAVQVLPSRNESNEIGRTIIVRFEDDPRRPQLLSRWQEGRDEWARNEKPARDALKIFERLYELHGQIERESERVELVLGDGILNWRHLEGGIHHPILLQRLQLEFDPSVPEFTISETDHPTELYSALFRSIPEVDGRAIGRCLDELQQGSYHPLGGEATSDFLRSLVVQLAAHGEFAGPIEPQGAADHPRIGRSPVVFLRTRTLGFATAIEEVLKDLQQGQNPPPSLTRLVGIDSLPSEGRLDSHSNSPVFGNEDAHILLSKPANPEQLHIAQRLEEYSCVLVQGPPGTGKTHTIGNLIGHLLAQGKSILVTSHTTKALRMVREQVVEELQPLCVSVLERDVVGRDQLKSSIGTIVRKSSDDSDRLESEATLFDKRRHETLARLKQARDQLLKARADEYRTIVVAGENYYPSEAARKIAVTKARDSWIPGPVAPGAPLPLSLGELSELYNTNMTVTAEDESELATAIPALDDLLSPEEFEGVADGLGRLAGEDLHSRSDLWQDSPETGSPEGLEAFLRQLKHAVEPIHDSEPWIIAAIDAGHQGGPEREPWDNLLSTITAVRDEAAGAQEVLLRYGPSIVDESLDYQALILDQIIKHLKGGGRLGWWTLLTHGSWKPLLANVRVGQSVPQRIEHFLALQTLVHLKAARHRLLERWERQVVPLGAVSAADLGDRPEQKLAQFCQPILDALDWHAKVWVPLEQEFERQGFRWQAFLKDMPVNFSQHGELLRLRDAVLTSLPPIFASRVNRLRRDSLEQKLSKLTTRLSTLGSGEGSAEVVRVFYGAVTRRDPPSYRMAFERLSDLHSRRRILNRRQELLHRLEVPAPVWSGAIRSRRPPHDGQNLPGDPASAWLWRQLHQELEHRSRVSLEELQKDIAGLNEQLQQTTAELIDRRAWTAQILRTSLKQQLALTGWLQTVNKIGKGTGRYAPRQQAEARRLLGECQTAVPVWIMPLARVVENFNPGTYRFDVVIIDEASQSDLMGLLALYLGRQVIVVGDDEQVSPDAVGLDQEQVKQLQEQFLRGIPNAHLYDGQTSVYDLAGMCFGGTIRLVEHFRCVPEIIQFSNHLSYNGEIKPLRGNSSVRLKPQTVDYRVEGASSKDRENEAEALTIASLLVAATEQPEYQTNAKGEPVTMGVISLVGEEQAFLIDSLLRRHLSPIEYRHRRIVCGNAAQFQGDERDVMFISVVDGPQEGPLALREAGPRGMFKKRFNVAASRARDQMWVIYSLDPQTDLKAGDLRRRLIEHAQDPQALMRSLEQGERRTESEFETQVFRQLVAAGYRVIPQWKAGYYRIDMVVEGSGKRLAVECDGDRYHSLDKLDQDMARQAILERLGWTFVHIRGSQFFRDPEGAMRPVFARLETLGIPPEPDSAGAQGNVATDSELRERLIRRAEELRRKWQNQGQQGFDSPGQSPPRQGRVPAETDEIEHLSPTNRGYALAGQQQPLLGDPSQANPQLVPESDLTAYLSQKGLEVIDKRLSGGNLWVVGGLELSELMKELSGRGIKFSFVSNGGRATGHRPSWFTRQSQP